MVETVMTVPEFAKSIGYNKVNVYAVINGNSKSPAIRQKISEAVHIPVSEIWPELTEVDGK